MPHVTCSVESCERAANAARGWCNGHYDRWRRLGDVGADKPLGGYHRSPEESFAARTEGRDGCLVWTGGADPKGYGRITLNGVSYQAHRYAWERTHGQIPDGMYVDHKCWTKACVDAGHLRLASHGENAQNRRGAESRNKSSGVRNVYSNGRGWQVTVARRYRGTFDTIAEATVVAEAARAKLFGSFAGRG